MSLSSSDQSQAEVTAHPGQSPRLLWMQHATNIRRLGAYLVVGIVLALATGPSGSQNALTSGITGALFAPRIVVFLLIGVALWALVTLRERYGESLREWSTGVGQARRDALANPYVKWGLGAALLAVAIFVPPSLSLFWQSVLVQQIGTYALLAVGLNVVVGFAGLLDLGYIAFFAIGAYIDAYFTGALPVHPPIHLNPFFVIPIAVIACLLAGVLLGAPTLRLRGDYLAIVTLGFGEIIYIVANNADSITNGPRGAVSIPHFSAFGYKWGLDNLPYWYLLLGFLLVIVFLFSRLENSRVGRAWTAIREDEVAAAASGVATIRYKLMAFAIGASVSGIAGVLFASQINFIAPVNFVLLFSILALVFVIFGGMGSIIGVIVGATVLQWLPNALRDYVQSQDRFIYFGLLLVAMMIFRPQGLVPSRRRSREIAMSEHGVGDADAMSEPAGGRPQ